MFKVTKNSKNIYLKDEDDLEKFIIKNSNEIKKYKKGSKEYITKFELEKSKLSIQRFKGLGEMNPEDYGIQL